MVLITLAIAGWMADAGLMIVKRAIPPARGGASATSPRP
jgi:hypothetical protein